MEKQTVKRRTRTKAEHESGFITGKEGNENRRENR